MACQNYILSYSDERIVGLIIRVNVREKGDTEERPRIEDRTGTFYFKPSREGGNEYAMHLIGHPEDERTVTRDPTPLLELDGLELEVLKNADFQLMKVDEGPAEEMMKKRDEEMEKFKG